MDVFRIPLHYIYRNVKVITEEDIAIQLRKGSTEAFARLYDQYADYLFGVCYRYVGDQQTAEDLMHDGLLQVYDNIGSFKWTGPGSLKRWLYIVQRNVVMMHLRKMSIWSETATVDAEMAEEDIAEPENIDDISSEEICRMIAELPQSYRTIFNMYVIDGYSHREIAELLGIQEKASSSELAKARKILAAKINRWRKQNL